MSKRPLTVVLSISMLMASMLAGTPSSAAQTDDPGLLRLEPKMRPGTWFGSGIVGGLSTMNEQGIDLELRADLHGSFFLDVRLDDSRSSGTSTEGEWDIIAPSTSTVLFKFAEGDALFEGTYTGTGEVTGDSSRVSGTATVVQAGTLTVAGTGYNADLVDELPAAISAVVTTAFCNEVYGEWELSWNAILEGFGWTPTFTGTWVAVRQSEEFEEEIENGNTVEEVVRSLNQTLDDWNAFASAARSRDWSTPFSRAEIQSMLGLIETVESMLNELRNLSFCDKQRFGEHNLEYFESALMDSLGEVIHVATEYGDLPPIDIFNFARAGRRTGATGPGSDGRADEALRREAEQRLEELTAETEEDGQVGIGWRDSDDTDIALIGYSGVGSGWEFELHGWTVSADQLVAAVEGGGS